MLHEIYEAETKKEAEQAFDRFVEVFEPKHPRAAECLAKDRALLLAFYDFPAEHWRHIRSTRFVLLKNLAQDSGLTCPVQTGASSMVTFMESCIDPDSWGDRHVRRALSTMSKAACVR